jgi:ABC-type antimicrobial peptide transport system permease subunit
LTLLAATNGEPLAAIEPLREIVSGLDPQVPLYNVRPLDRFYVDGVLGTQQVLMEIVAAMAAVGLALALVGLYAVITYAASRRMREFAIRLAIGATRGTVVRLVLREGAFIAAAGIGIGLLLSAPVGRALGAAFVGLGPLNLWVFAIVPTVVLALTLTACLVPALRSSMVAPVTVLKLE